MPAESVVGKLASLFDDDIEKLRSCFTNLKLSKKIVLVFCRLWEKMQKVVMWCISMSLPCGARVTSRRGMAIWLNPEERMNSRLNRSEWASLWCLSFILIDRYRGISPVTKTSYEMRVYPTQSPIKSSVEYPGYLPGNRIIFAENSPSAAWRCDYSTMDSFAFHLLISA